MLTILVKVFMFGGRTKEIVVGVAVRILAVTNDSQLMACEVLTVGEKLLIDSNI